jgi:hypothetical protein
VRSRTSRCKTIIRQALLLKGKMLLAQNRFREAVDALQNGCEAEIRFQNISGRSLRRCVAAGRENEASEDEAKLRERGASRRSANVALYLATRHESPETALRLARAELDSASDVFTHDALAWSLAAAGK